MKKAKKAIIGGVIAVALTATGLNGNVQKFAKKTYDCTSQEVQFIESSDLYFCGSREEYKRDIKELKQRLKDNKMNGKFDVGLGYLASKHDEKEMDEFVEIFKSKYIPAENRFDGSKLDSDVIDQLDLAMLIASVKCNGQCILYGSTMTERVYGLLIQ